jgi:hypothetical protein
VNIVYDANNASMMRVRLSVVNATKSMDTQLKSSSRLHPVVLVNSDTGPEQIHLEEDIYDNTVKMDTMKRFDIADIQYQP